MKFKKNTFLIIGANGLIGRAITKEMKPPYSWVGTYKKREAQGLIKLDLTSDTELNEIFTEVNPEIVINCANLAGGVDFCENNPDIAKQFHLDSTKKIVKLCKERDSLFVFISTDYVFDGTEGPYKENEEVNPLNLYGKLKLEAEQWIQNNLIRYLIIRTTNVYGWDPETVTPNYIMNLYVALKENKTFNAPSFLYGNPTYVGDLSKAIFELCENDSKGIFHVVGKTFINRLNWAMELCKTLDLDSSLVHEISQPPSAMVPRPLKSWLVTDKFTHSYKTILHDVSDGLRFMKADISAKGY